MKLKEMIDILANLSFEVSPRNLVYIEKISDFEFNGIFDIKSGINREKIPEHVMESKVIAMKPSIILDYWKLYSQCDIGSDCTCYYITTI